MEIQLAEKKNLIEVIYIIRECSRQFHEKGVKYWNSCLPDYNEIAEDIANQRVYLMVNNRVTIGTITIKPEKTNPKTYEVSRLAIYPPFQNRGFAHEILKFSEDFAKKNGSTTLKGTVPIDDTSTGLFLEEYGFINQGVEGDVPDEFTRIRFEKEIV